jgi:hypothetical protein
MVVTVALLGVLGSRDARAQHAEIPAEPEPRRPDIVATFPAGGFIQFNANGQVGTTSLRHGLISLSSDHPFCVASPTNPCRYTINVIELVAEDASVGGTSVTNIRARNMNAAVGVIDAGGGMRLTVPPGMNFQVSGEVNGQPTAFLVTATAPNRLTLVIDPELQQIVLFGNLAGSQDGFSLHLDILATSEAPFTNVPPVANAGPDQHHRTGCYAQVTLDPSATHDPNGDRVYWYYTQSGYSIGDGSEPIAFLPGTHRLVLHAFDELGARGTDEVIVTVEDDGSSEPVPGSTIVAVETPPGVAVEDTAVLASQSLSLRARSTAGASAISFGTSTLFPGATIAARARHTAGVRAGLDDAGVPTVADS